MDITATHIRELLEFASLPDDDRKRNEALDLARKLTGQYDKSAVLLWLYDKEKERFHLDHHHPISSQEGPGRLARKSVVVPLSSKDEKKTIDAAIRSQRDVLAWLSSRGLSGGQRISFHFPETDETPRGVLEVVTDAEIKEPETVSLKHLLAVITARIKRHRYSRRLRVYKSFADIGRKTADSLVHEAVDIVRRETHADLVILMKQDPQMSLVAVAASPRIQPVQLSQLVASPDSLVRRMFHSRLQVRILDHSDKAQIYDVFKTTAHDEQFANRLRNHLGRELRSWMAHVIAVEDDRLGVILAINKNPQQYLPGVFSATDYRILKDICQLIGHALPQAELDDAIQICARWAGKVSLEKPEDRREVFAGMKKFISGLESAAISIRPNQKSAPVELLNLGPDRALAFPLEEMARDLYRRPSTDGNLVRLTDFLMKPNFDQFYYIHPMPVDPKFAALHLVLSKSTFASHDKDALKFLASYLEQMIRGLLTSRREVEALVQVRHAIRASLQGLSHVDVACNVFGQIEASIASAPKVTRLRKALQNAKMFTDRSRTLVDESYYLLDSISREKLVLSRHSVSELAQECKLSLVADLERRRIEMEINVRRPADSRFEQQIDQRLMLISLFNLMDNAVKYAHWDTQIQVDLFERGSSWCISVQNTGVYIHPDDKDAIFEPLQRRPTGGSHRTRPGSGLGLAVVRQVANAHGGEVSFTSELENPNKPSGPACTEFTMRIPRILP